MFYEFGHIPGAKNLSRKQYEEHEKALEPLLKTVIENKAAVIVYCSGRHCEDSGIVAKKLIERGIKAVFLFEGGWDEWKAAGLPQEKGGGQ